MGDGCLVQRLRDLCNCEFKARFTKHPPATGSVYGSMQCMLKGVCSQCPQWQIDPATGKRTKTVFACSWQDQPLDLPDYDNLRERLAQNRLSKHLTDLWLDTCSPGMSSRAYESTSTRSAHFLDPDQLAYRAGTNSRGRRVAMGT